MTTLLSAVGSGGTARRGRGLHLGAVGNCRTSILFCRPPHWMGHVENFLPMALPWGLSFAELGFCGI